MKFATLQQIKDYLKIKHNIDDELLNLLHETANLYIIRELQKNDTELAAIQKELFIVELLLVESMYNQRTYTVQDTREINPIVKSILDYYGEQYVL